MSRNVEKSQLHYYDSLGYKEHYKGLVKCFANARESLFKRIDSLNVDYRTLDTVFIVEAHDVTNASVYGALVLKESRYYYYGNCGSKEFYNSSEPCIDDEMIRLFLSGDYSKLSDTKRLTSWFHLGTTIIRRGNRFEITHQHWQ